MAKCKHWSKTPSIVANGKSFAGLDLKERYKGAEAQRYKGEKLCASVPLYLCACSFITFIFLAIFLGLSTVALAASIPVGTVDMVEGVATARHDHQKSTHRIQKGDKIYTLDEIITGKGAKVKISFINRSTIHLGGDSHLIVTSVLYAPQKSLNKFFFRLSIGKLRAVVEKFSSPDSKFEVETKTAVAGVVGTEEIVSVSISPETGKEITRVICQTGHLLVRSSDPKIHGEISLESLEQSWIKEDEGPEEKSKISPDELEKLVRETTIAPEGKISDKAPDSQKKEEKKGSKSLAKNSSEQQGKKDESARREPPPSSAGQQGAGQAAPAASGQLGQDGNAREGENTGERQNLSDRVKDAEGDDRTTARQQGEGVEQREFKGSEAISGVSPVKTQEPEMRDPDHELEIKDPDMKDQKPEVKSLLGETPKLLENAPSLENAPGITDVPGITDTPGLEITPGIDQEKNMIGADRGLEGPDHDNPDDGVGKDSIDVNAIDVDAAVGENDLGVTDPVMDFGREEYALPPFEDTILKEIIPDIEDKYHETLELLPAPPGPPR